MKYISSIKHLFKLIFFLLLFNSNHYISIEFNTNNNSNEDKSEDYTFFQKQLLNYENNNGQQSQEYSEPNNSDHQN